nr:MATE family efflux transporter [uncultured Lichenicoccus sp.]
MSDNVAAPIGVAETLVARTAPVTLRPGDVAPHDGRALRITRREAILSGPVLPTLLRLGLPTVGVLLAQTVVSVAEGYWTSFLGTEAIAGMALAFPLAALMTATSNGGIGGGVSAAVSRAVGRGHAGEADSLLVHALVLAVAFGVLFTVGAFLAGPFLYRVMGGSGGSLAAALLFSSWFFAGSVPIWAVNLMAAALRGAGEVRLPAVVTLTGALVVIPLSPALIFGVGPLPRMGLAGAGLATNIYSLGAALVLLRHLLHGRGALRLRRSKLRWATFRAILGVGSVSALGALIANLTVMLVTAAVGLFGVDALAGYGIASRLDWLLIPLLFGLGSGVVTMVGAATGANDHARARRVAWTAVLLAVGPAGGAGLLASLCPHAWLGLFTDNPAALEAGTHYLRIVAPAYVAIGFGMMLYFASQGLGRMLWPFVAGVARLVIGAGGSLVLARSGADISTVFAAVTAGSLAYGALNAVQMRRVASSEPPCARAPLQIAE